MYAAGTRVKLLAAVDAHPAGTEGFVVYDLGSDVCQIALLSGEQLIVRCSLLEASDVTVAAD